MHANLLQRFNSDPGLLVRLWSRNFVPSLKFKPHFENFLCRLCSLVVVLLHTLLYYRLSSTYSSYEYYPKRSYAELQDAMALFRFHFLGFLEICERVSS